MARTGHHKSPETFPPPLKPSSYGAGIALYTFIAGVCGALQILVTIVDLMGRDAPDLVLWGRMVAAGGAAAGGALLIYELHTPQRFYNMMRIVRLTSPMSFGAYVLLAFGLFSVLAAGASLAGFPTAAATAGVVACGPAVVMAFYSATLLSATSSPFWAAYPQALAVRFAASSMAAACAVLVLIAILVGGPQRNVMPLLLVGAAALLLDGLTVIAQRRDADRPGWGTSAAGMMNHLGAVGVGILLPLAAGALAWRMSETGGLTLAGAALGVLLGAFLMRWAVVKRGNETAATPADYLRFTGTADADLAKLHRGSGQW
jgi:hypothetical protein